MTFITDQTFDKQGRVIQWVFEQFYYTIALTNRSVTSWAYMEDNVKIVSFGEHDSDGDGIVDSTSRWVAVKGQRGQIVSSAGGGDDNGDGVLDLTTDQTLSYDKHGNLVEWILTSAGGYAAKFIITYTYEGLGAVRQQSRAENQLLDMMRQRLWDGPSRLTFQGFMSQGGRGSSKN